jgi:hypothetical protein
VVHEAGDATFERRIDDATFIEAESRSAFEAESVTLCLPNGVNRAEDYLACVSSK